MLDPFLKSLNQDVIMFFLVICSNSLDQQAVSNLLVLHILLLSLINILDILGFILWKIILNYWLSLHSFFNENKTQFGQVIIILRSDNAKEYFSNFSAVSSSHDILYQFTLSHTSIKWYCKEKKKTLCWDCSYLIAWYQYIRSSLGWWYLKKCVFILIECPLLPSTIKFLISLFLPKWSSPSCFPHVFCCVGSRYYFSMVG